VKALLDRLHLRLPSLCASSTKNKCGSLARPEAELGGDIGGLLSEGDRGVQCERSTASARWGKNGAPLFDIDLHSVSTPRIIKSRLALHLEMNLAPDDGDGADNLIRLHAVRPNRHEVRQFGHTFVCKKSRQQNVRVWQIQLSHPPFSQLRLNLKTATFLIIEQGCKHAGRIEIWVAKKVDGTVYTHEGNRAHIANYPVVLNRFKAHSECQLRTGILAHSKVVNQSVETSSASRLWALITRNSGGLPLYRVVMEAPALSVAPVLSDPAGAKYSLNPDVRVS
jgi:hypothetical protein